MATLVHFVLFATLLMHSYTLGSLLGGIGDTVGGVVGGVGGVVGGVGSGLNNTLTNVGGGLGGVVGGIGDGLGGVVGGVVGGVGGVVGDVVGGVGGVVGGVVGGIGGVVDGVVGGVGGLLGGLLGRCSKYTDDKGVVHDNRCLTQDKAALCNNDTFKPMCTCSPAYTDTYCGVSIAALNKLENISNSGSLISIIKGPSAQLQSSLPAILAFLTEEQKIGLSWRVGDLIIDASFEGRRIDIENEFTMFNDPSLGNCFTFNHYNKSSPYKLRKAGTSGALRVVLASHSSEYLPWVETVGVGVYIHPIGRDIYIESSKHTTSPSGYDDLMLRKTSFARLSGVFGHCAKGTNDAQSFYYNGDYTVDGCYRSCYQDSVLAACGCMDPSYRKASSAPPCSLDKLECISSMAERRGDPVQWKECRCPDPCYQEEYFYTVSRTSFTNLYSCHPDDALTNSSIPCQDGWSHATVAFPSYDIDVRSEGEKYPFSKVLGMTGSFGGVLLGMSIVFSIDLLILLRNLLIYLVSGSVVRVSKRLPTGGRTSLDG